MKFNLYHLSYIITCSVGLFVDHIILFFLSFIYFFSTPQALMLDSISISLSLPPIPPRLAPRSSPHPSALPLLITPLQSGHRQIVRRRSRTNMSSEHRRLSSPENYSELNDESDFETIVSPDGFISICGFGSLLSGTYDQVTFFIIIVVSMFFNFLSFGRPIFLCEPERSARSTFPDLIKFRVARLTGFRRVFAHAAPIFFERGIAKPETKVPRDNIFLFLFSFINLLGKLQDILS